MLSLLLLNAGFVFLRWCAGWFCSVPDKSHLRIGVIAGAHSPPGHGHCGGEGVLSQEAERDGSSPSRDGIPGIMVALPSQTCQEVCLRGDSGSCQVGNQELPAQV